MSQYSNVIVVVVFLCRWVILHDFMLSADFFKIKIYEKFFLKNDQCQQFGSRSGQTFCWAWSGSKLFAKYYFQNMPLTGKELKVVVTTNTLLVLNNFWKYKFILFFKIWMSAFSFKKVHPKSNTIKKIVCRKCKSGSSWSLSKYQPDLDPNYMTLWW